MFLSKYLRIKKKVWEWFNCIWQYKVKVGKGWKRCGGSIVRGIYQGSCPIKNGTSEYMLKTTNPSRRGEGNQLLDPEHSFMVSPGLPDSRSGLGSHLWMQACSFIQATAEQFLNLFSWNRQTIVFILLLQLSFTWPGLKSAVSVKSQASM